VSLVVDVEEGMGTIAADVERLQQIVWNLLSNAIKFTQRGGHVEIFAGRVESNVVIRVTDDGQGIAPDFLPHLFETFRQADSSPTRRHGGLGLGLSIVRQLVHAHRGKITAHSAGVGEGACFTVELPVRPVATGGERAPPIAPVVRLNGLRLLVVDDDEDARDLVQNILTRQGADVSTASSADEALAILATVSPDVLLSDIGMPNVSGYSLIRRIRSLPADRGGDTPAIALTAYARPEDGERAFTAGFQAHVTKPIDPDRLTALVANLAGTSSGAKSECTPRDGSTKA
jgi:CheY-like chemotaxis protein